MKSTSSHRNEYEILLRRAHEFLEESVDALSKGRYDIACFLAEQAVQLYLKSKLLMLIGDYPRTHYIRALLGELINGIEDEEARKKLMEYIKANRAKISELEDAYIMSRYTGKTYSKEDAEELIMLAKEIIKIVEEVIK